MDDNKTRNTKQSVGFYVSLFGTVLILLWVGLYKFIPTEAEAIKSKVISHPLTFWMYDIMSTQAVSYCIGIVEITVALLIVIGLRYKFIAKIAALSIIVIFVMTLSYIFTTAGMWKIVDGFPITNFFILKDIMYLGFGLSFFQYANN